MNEEAMEVRKAVAAEVRALMGRYQVTQTALATEVGMSQPALSRCLNAKQAFDLDQLVGIAKYFNQPITQLVDVSGNLAVSSDQLIFDLDASPEPEPIAVPDPARHLAAAAA